MVITVGTPEVERHAADRGSGPNAEACAPLEEGIVNTKAIDPAHGAGLETITRVTAVAVANGDRNHPTLGASAFGSDDD
jgi:hypothetical protein